MNECTALTKICSACARVLDVGFRFPARTFDLLAYGIDRFNTSAEALRPAQVSDLLWRVGLGNKLRDHDFIPSSSQGDMYFMYFPSYPFILGFRVRSFRFVARLERLSTRTSVCSSFQISQTPWQIALPSRPLLHRARIRAGSPQNPISLN